MSPGREGSASPAVLEKRQSFATTHWSVVLATRDAEPDRAHQALECLCATYWYPVYACIRRLGKDHAEAEDIAQGFFGRLLSNQTFQHLEPARTRLRAYLWVALRRYVQETDMEAHRRKRSGSVPHLSWDTLSARERYRCEAVDRWTPEQLFDRRWALALLDRALQRLKNETAVTRHPELCLFFTPDGDRLVVGAKEEAAIYDSRSGQEMARMAGAEGKMFSLQPDPKAEHYVTVTLTDHFLRYRFCLWTTNGLVRDLGETEPRLHQTVAFSPDGSLLCMSGNLARASVHDMASGEVMFPIPVGVNSAAFSPDAKRLATRGGSSTISIWEIAERRELLQLKGHPNPVHDMAFSPDGRLLVSVDAKGTVKIWSALTGREILDHPGLIWGVSHTPDGRKVATAPLPDGVAIWDTQSGRQLAQLRRLNRTSTCVAFSPDDEHLAAGDVFGDIAIWNVGTGTLVHLLKAHDFAQFGGLCYSRDGRLLASAAWDGKIRIWDPASGTLRRTLSRESIGGWSMDFSPSNRRLAVTETNLVRIWNVETGRCERELRGHADEVQGVRFNADGT